MHPNLWLRALTRRLFVRLSSSSAKRRTARMRPHLESLEDRKVPAVLTVGPQQEYAMPSLAAAAAHDGDTIQIYSNGNYSGDTCHWTQNNLTIEGVGGGRAHIDDTGTSVTGGKAIWLISGTNTTVNNIEFSGAHDTINSDDNWAGIKLEGNTLTLNNDYFHNNDDGVLVAATNTNLGSVSNVVIDGSEFANNGFGDGQSHNMYIGQVTSFTLENSYSHDANEGHLVKSRALTNYILYNRLQDGAAPTSTASYELDLPQGGLSYVIGNIIEQGPNSPNHTIITYSEEGTKNPDQHLYLVNNTIVNDYSGSSTFLALPDASSSALIENNIFCGPGTLVSGAGSTTQTTNLVSNSPGFVNQAGYDYHLTAGSAVINAGTAPGSVNGFNLTPTAEYVDQLGLQPRPVNGAIDIGAFEYTSSATTPTTIDVNDPSGGMDNPANVTVTTLGSNVTLRDAINAADNTGGSGSYIIELPADNTITFASPVNNTTITSNNTLQNQNWYGPNALPAITSNITIEGNNDTLQVASGTDMRFFYVSGGPNLTGGALSLGTLELDNLTLTGGVAQGGNGSGGGLGAGGAIFNQGNLTLNGDTLTNNQAIGGNGGFGGGGGGMGSSITSGSLAGGGFGGNFSITGGPTGGSGDASGNAGGGAGFLSSANGSNASSTQAGAGGGLGGFGGAGGGATGGAAGDGGGGGNGTTSGGSGGSFGVGGLAGSNSSASGGGGGGVGGGGGGDVVASTFTTSGSGGGGGFGGGGGAGLSAGDGGFGGGGGSASSVNGGLPGMGGFGGGPGGGGGAGMGGGIFNMFGTLTITNSTLSDNTAQGGTHGLFGGSGLGGALFNLDGKATLTAVNLANNNSVIDAQAAAASANGSAVYNLAYGNTVTTGGTTTATMILKAFDLSAGTGGDPLVNDVDITKNPSTAVFDIYDPQGRLINILYPGGNVLALAYNTNGVVTQAMLTNPHGPVGIGVNSITYNYNSGGQFSTVVEDLTNGNVLTNFYTNNVVTTAQLTNPNGPVANGVMAITYTYSGGKVTSAADLLTNGNVMTYNYDTNGVVTSAKLTNPNPNGTVANGVTSISYNYSVGKVTSAAYALTNGNVMTYNYDTNGVVTSAKLTNPNGTVANGVTSITYDYSGGQVTSAAYALTNGNTLTYDYTNGIVTTATLVANDNKTTLESFTFSSGQVATVTYASNNNVVNYSYNGSVVQGAIVTNGGSQVQTWAYNGQGQILRITYVTNGVNGNVLNYKYTNGVLTSSTLMNGNTALFNYNYNAQGRITTIYDGSDTTLLQTYNYNPQGQLANIVYNSNNTTLTYTYTGIGSAATAKLTDNNNPNNVLQTDTFDVYGRVTEIDYATNGNVYSRTYDPDGDGISWATLSNNGTTLDYYEYDAQGNLLYGPSPTQPSPWPPT